eukprot:m.34821 g.34821  ORF g.34821 m.34821 type:complete len:180 (+) comp5693_c0_seq2:213-752(+)
MHLQDFARTLAKVEEAKTAGNAAFRSGDLDGAMQKYHTGLMMARAFESKPNPTGIADSRMNGMDEATKSLFSSYAIDLRNNIAAIHIKRENYQRAESITAEVLAIDPGNRKALLRMCKALHASNNLVRLDGPLARALALAPEDPDLRRIKADVDRRERKYRDKERSRMLGMFDRMNVSE